MHARLESKTARSVKEELQIHVNDWVLNDKKKSMSVFFLQLCSDFMTDETVYYILISCQIEDKAWFDVYLN